MPIVTVGSLLISIIAVGIAAHTKLQQRESRELRGLAQKLSDLQDTIEVMKSDLEDFESNEDFELAFEDIAREALACKHETGNNVVQIGLTVERYPENDSTKTVKIDEPEDLIDAYKSDTYSNMTMKVGNREELYVTDRRVYLYDPFMWLSSIYNELDAINEQYEEKLEEFDSDLTPELRKHVDKVVERNSRNRINNVNWFDVNLDEHDTIAEIEDYIFEQIFHYDGIEEDLDELGELTEEIEELRQGILQASYS